jgi:predicted phage tail protein
LIQTAAQAAFAIAIMPLFAGGVGRTWNWRLVGGVAQLLTPTPKISKDEGDPRKSFSFSGIQNVSTAQVFQFPWFTVKRWSAAL